MSSLVPTGLEAVEGAVILVLGQVRLVGDWSSGHRILCRVWQSSERAQRTCCTRPGMSSIVSILFAKGVEATVSLAGVGWSEVFSMDDCSLCLRELLFVSNCTTFCINTGISSQVSGVAQLPLALLESLPLPRKLVNMPRVGHCFALLVLVPSPRDRVVQPQIDCCFGILVLYQEEKNKSFLLVTALVAWLAYLPIMRTCYYACANSVLNAHPRHGFPTLTCLMS